MANNKPVGITCAGCYVVARPTQTYPLSQGGEAIHGLLLSDMLRARTTNFA